MRLGPNFNPTGLKPEITIVFPIINEVCSDQGVYDIILSSGTDRKHGYKSLHYPGLAVDFYWRGYKHEDAELVKSVLKNRLGLLYDVVVEDTHIHIEYQPK